MRFEEPFIIVGSLAFTIAGLWLITLMEFQFHIGFLLGMGLVALVCRVFNGFWPGDHRFTGLRVDRPQRHSVRSPAPQAPHPRLEHLDELPDD